MRFRFLGGSDAPDWLLAEVSVLSKMSSVRMKLIARQIINQLSGKGVAYDKITKLTSSTRIQLDPPDIKALIAALHYVYASAVRWGVEGVVLLMELEQLGLPKDVCTAMVKEYDVARDELRQHLRNQTLTLPQVTDVDWRVDYVLASSALTSVNAPSVRLRFHLSKPAAGQSLLPCEMSVDQFTLLHAELRAARRVMETLQT